ncbi:MAG: hypothetical protein ACRDV2_16175 [Actinomycetes bacterium]
MSKPTHVLMVSPDGKPWKCPLGYVDRATENGFRLVDEASHPEGDAFFGGFDPDSNTDD